MNSSSSKRDAAWNAASPSSHSPSTKRNQSPLSFFLALAVAAGVALGLLFGARDVLVRGGAVLQSTLASELVERLESQVRIGPLSRSRRHRNSLSALSLSLSLSL